MLHSQKVRAKASPRIGWHARRDSPHTGAMRNPPPQRKSGEGRAGRGELLPLTQHATTQTSLHQAGGCAPLCCSVSRQRVPEWVHPDQKRRVAHSSKIGRVFRRDRDFHGGTKLNGTIYWWKATPLKGKGTIYFESDCENASTLAKDACGVKCNVARLDEKPEGLKQQLAITARFTAPANPAIAETRQIPIYIEGKL